MKSFYTMEKIAEEEIVSNETFEKIKLSFKSTKKLVDFLNRAIEIK